MLIDLHLDAKARQYKPAKRGQFKKQCFRNIIEHRILTLLSVTVAQITAAQGMPGQRQQIPLAKGHALAKHRAKMLFLLVTQPHHENETPHAPATLYTQPTA
ncbi:hypothetical protein [Vreelandella lutescens]|uniref:Uncharacterized protein n=1 Tax=Vreelandella lutescens TaxID=1602943 RepID=A0ABQ1NP74_9GAMM|nr:hypothetical protein [Halomonas lutescens]GGC81522.1 hypothetical protein GCM10011382_09610 [Halomonas lutescens]